VLQLLFQGKRPDRSPKRSLQKNIDINFRAVSQITLHAQPYRELRRSARNTNLEVAFAAAGITATASFPRQRLDALKHQPSY
jgi:hypothetical protein